jgi:hypothetical protein
MPRTHAWAALEAAHEAARRTDAKARYRVGLAALQWPARAIAALLHGDALPALGRARLTPDPTDLLALPALLMSPLLVRSRSRLRSHDRHARGHRRAPRRTRPCPG